MRKTLIISAATVSLLTLSAAGVTSAGESRPAVVPPSTIPGLDMLSDMGITPEQSQCLVESATGVDTADMNAVIARLTECGVDLLSLALPGAPTTAGAVTEITTTETIGGIDPSVAIDPTAAAAVLEALGVDPTGAQCVADGLAVASTVGDDEEALTILQGCGLSLSSLLFGLLTVAAAAGGEAPPTSAGTGPVSTAGGPDVTTDVVSDNPLVAQVQETLEAQGIELNDEQVSCLVDNVAELDMSDINSSLAVFEACGISLTDLAPQG